MTVGNNESVPRVRSNDTAPNGGFACQELLWENGDQYSHNGFSILDYLNKGGMPMIQNSTTKGYQYSKRIGSTVYKVNVVIPTEGTESMEEKILRMIRVSVKFSLANEKGKR